MHSIAFLKIEFALLVVSSLVIPASICWFLVHRQSISRVTVLILGLLLIVVASIDAVLLRHLFEAAKASEYLPDDVIFASEFSVALFALPLLAAGLGVNLLSHLLTAHLRYAELRHDRELRANHRRHANGETAGGGSG